jgi:hypothetical protein
MYIPKYFNLQEFFPRDYFKEVYPKLGERMWILIDYRVLFTADALRDRYGTMIANDWLWRTGGHQYRGFRPPNCTIGATFSQHRFGRALDCKFKHVEAEEVRQDIKANDEYAFKHITTIEINVTWLHFDCRNHDKKIHGIKLIKP